MRGRFDDDARARCRRDCTDDGAGERVRTTFSVKKASSNASGEICEPPVAPACDRVPQSGATKRSRRRPARKRAGGRVISGVLLATGTCSRVTWSATGVNDPGAPSPGAELLADFAAFAGKSAHTSARTTNSPNGNPATSDDASGSSDAQAAPSAAACADREACAEAAGYPGGENEHGGRTDAADGFVGAHLLGDAAAFAEEMHRRVNLFVVGQRLLLSDDEKIAQRALERILEMRYGKGAVGAGEEAPQVQVDLPRPVRN